MVFFPTAWDAGQILNGLALMHNFHIVSAPWDSPARIVDMVGPERTDVAREIGWVCGPVNVEKEVLHLDYQEQQVLALQRKYARDIKVTWHRPEDRVTLESRTPEVTVAQVMQEYGLINWDAYIRRATGAQDAKRGMGKS